MVGASEREEINVEPADDAGGQNYGWHWLEGTTCWYPERPRECELPYTPPVYQYNHDEGDCSISGIGVYRGTTSPTLVGSFVFADFCSGRVWALSRDSAVVTGWSANLLVDTDLLLTGGGVDQSGEVYLTSCGCDLSLTPTVVPSTRSAIWHLSAGLESSPSVVP